MTTLLYVNGSPRNGDSHSNKVAQAFLAARREVDPDVIVDTIDLWHDPLPEFDGDKAAAKMTVITGGQLAGATITAWDEIQRIAARFTAADEYLFAVPMWNGGVPYRLKLYIDILTQPGILFGFAPATGYTGLLQSKRATSVYTSGVFSPGAPPAFGVDFHATYFDDWLRFIGIRDIEGIRFQPTLLTNDYDGDLAVAIAAAQAAARRAR
jgi:FMN-dependent NADH-azoreductase